MYVVRPVAASNTLLVESGFKGGLIAMIRSRCLLIPLLFNVLLPNAGMSKGQAVTVSAESDGTVQITARWPLP
jgi:hypothetical protein